MNENQTSNDYQILLFYKYLDLQNPEEFMKIQRNLCQKLNLKGRILISNEGVNGTLEGLVDDTEKYVDFMLNQPEFAGMDVKRSQGTGEAFPKLQVRVREEIVTTRLDQKDEVGPHKGVTGKYISAEELHNWIKDGKKEFYIVDMRNDYEYASGHFKDSVLLKNFKTFRDLPNVLPQLEHLKNKTIVTVCTGGVRCEKASGFLLKEGFNDVYQLHNGIVTYMEKYPNEDFLGKLYVFDNRFVMGFNLDSPEHVVIGRCTKCGKQSENYVDWKENGERIHGIVCQECVKNGVVEID